MRPALSRSRKPWQSRYRPLRSFRPEAEGLEDRLVLSHLEIVSESGSVGYSYFLGATRGGDSSFAFPASLELRSTDSAATTNIGGVAGPRMVGLGANTLVGLAGLPDHTSEYTSRAVDAFATGERLVRIVPDVGKSVGDPVRVDINISPLTGLGTGRFSATAGGFTQTGRYDMRIGDTIRLSISASAKVSGDQYTRASSVFTGGTSMALLPATTVTVTSSVVSVFGEPVTFTATVAPVRPEADVPTGRVDFYADGLYRGSVVLGGGVATTSIADLPAGDHTITAVYSGDGDFEGSHSEPLIHTVRKAKTDVIVTSAHPFGRTVFGEKATFSARVRVSPPGAGYPSGLVDFFANGVSIGSDDVDLTGFASVSTDELPVGHYSITARYHGDDNFERGDSFGFIHSVVKAESSTSVGIFHSSSLVGSSFVGEVFTVWTHVEAEPPGAGQPGGFVHFKESTGREWRLLLDPQGLASIQVPGDLPVGTYSYLVIYEGDANFKASSSLIAPHDVVKAGTRLDLDIRPNASVYGQAILITPRLQVVPPGAGGPTGFITYDFSNGRTEVRPVLAPALLVDDLPAGRHEITATYSGDDSFSASASPAAVHDVEKAVLTVEADDEAIERGAVIPALTASITGFVLGEGPDDLRGEPVLRTDATSASPADRYPIRVRWSTPTEDNYRFEFIDGSLTVHPKVVDVLVEWGGATAANHGARSISLLGLGRDLPFIDIKAIEVIFSDPVVTDRQSLDLTGAMGTGIRHVVESYRYNADTRTGRWVLARPLHADRLALDLDGVYSNPDIALADFNLNFAVLPGDFNGDRVVNSSDFVGIIQQILSVSAPFRSVWADLNGDSVVDLADFYLAAQNLGKRV